MLEKKWGDEIVPTKQAYKKRKRDRKAIKQLNKPSPQEDCRRGNVLVQINTQQMGQPVLV